MHPGLDDLIYSALSSAGYYFTVYANAHGVEENVSGEILRANLFFETVDCSSQAFVTVRNLRGIFASETQNAVFRVSIERTFVGHFYVPALSVPATRTMVGTNSGSGCEEVFPTSRESVEAFPNDPAITGVPNEPFTPPITLGQ